MSVTSQTPINRYAANGVTTVFPYQFKIVSQVDIKVTVDGVTKTLTTDYTVSGVGADAGGNVNFLSAPANGTTVVLKRNMQFLRATDYQDNGDLLADTLNPDQDAPVLMIQQIAEEIGRSATLPEDTSETVDATLPPPGAGEFIRWNVAGNALETTAAGPADDYFQQSGTGATLRSWQSKVGEAVSLKDFGAVGDGTTADTTAFTNALAAAAGRKLSIPAGTYKLPFTATDALTPPANCVIEGEGPGLTVLRFEPSSTTLRNLFNLSAGGFTLRNLSVQVVVPATGVVIFFTLSSNGLVLENCDLDGAVTNTGPSISHTAHMIGVPLSGTQTDIRLERCTVHRFNYGWLKASASTAVNRRIAAVDCDFYGNYNEDWSFNNPAGTLDGVQVSACRFREGAGRAASVSQIYCGFASVTDFSVTGCVFEGDADDAIHIEENCRGGSITGNSINTDGVGIFLTDNNQGGSYTMPQHITITGNTLRKAGTPNSAGSYGISLVYDGSPEVPAKGITVTGNTMVDYERGLLSGATLDDCCVISGNIADACTRGFQIEFASFAASGNVSKGCTTGLYNSTFGAVDGHVFSNCTTNADATSRPLILTDPVFMFPEFSVGAGSTTYKNLLPFGANDRAHGFLNVSVMSNVVADRGPRQDEVTWDGTTFTRTAKMSEGSGAMAVDTVRNAGSLAVQLFATNALSSVIVQAKFNGMVVVAV